MVDLFLADKLVLREPVKQSEFQGLNCGRIKKQIKSSHGP